MEIQIACLTPRIQDERNYNNIMNVANNDEEENYVEGKRRGIRKGT